MYWYEKTEDSEHLGYTYKYFEYIPLGSRLDIKEKYVHVHKDFLEWYERNKSL